MRKDYSITLGAGITGRWIEGDITNNEFNDLRTKILGSDEKNFLGYEINIGMRLKNIKALVRIPFINKDKPISGLTNVQPNTYIGFVGGFSLKL